MFRAVEAEVKPQALAVLAELEDLAASPSQATDSEIRTERWRSIAERLKASADDVCALFALYAEHATTLPVHDNPISNLLRNLIERAEERRRRRRPELDIICLAVVGIAMLAFAIGLLGTAFGLISYPHDNLRQALPVATGYLVGALLLYGPATFVAWDARHPIRPGDWQNAYEAAVVPPARQYLALFLIAYCVTVASQALFSLGDIALTHIGRAGDATVNASAVIDQFISRLPEGETPPSACETGKQPTQAVVWFAFSYGIVGAFHAVMFALMGDAVSAGKENSAGYRLIALHGVILALAVCLAGMLMDRQIPCVDGDGTIVPALNLDLAEELIAFEMLAAFILGVAFASLARLSLVRLRDGPLAPVPVSSGSQDG